MNASPPQRFRDPGLADFGVDPAGEPRRLERLGGVLVDRPLPLAVGARRKPSLWGRAAAAFVAGPPGRGRWEFRGPLPEPWHIEVPVGAATLALEVRPSPSGQLGVFLEQVDQWRWLSAVVPRGALMLSLFGHSGAATLALAAAGAVVVHVDASRQALALARRNAAASGLDSLPVRWVCDDARAFVHRARRRGERFAGAVLDPPSWGHGPKGQAFAIDRDLGPLLAAVGAVLDGRPGGPLLVTCHSPRWHPRRLRDTLLEACRPASAGPGRTSCGSLACSDDSGRRLELGGYARIEPAP